MASKKFRIKDIGCLTAVGAALGVVAAGIVGVVKLDNYLTKGQYDAVNPTEVEPRFEVGINNHYMEGDRGFSPRMLTTQDVDNDDIVDGLSLQGQVFWVAPGYEDKFLRGDEAKKLTPELIDKLSKAASLSRDISRDLQNEAYRSENSDNNQ